eukprot:4579554-Prymnesium_polylepis.2
MATNLARTKGLDAAVEMGEWSSRVVRWPSCTLTKNDPLAMTTYNATDVLMDFGEVLTAEVLNTAFTGVAGEAVHEAAVQHPLVEAQHPLVEADQQNAAGASQVANVLEGLRN